MIGVLEVFGEHDVAVVKQCSKLRNREVPDAPRVLELVGKACVEDEAPPGGGATVALSTAPSGLMKRGRRQLLGTISVMPCHVQVANLGPRAILAASLRSQLAWLGLRDGCRGKRGLGMQRRPSTMVVVTASSGPRRLCHWSAAMRVDMRSRVGVLLSLMYSGRKRDGKS